MNIQLNAYYTLIFATMVLIIGKYIVKKINFFNQFNIPIPVVGGLVISIILYILHYTYSLTININEDLKTSFMLMFFASIGLSANFNKLKLGGKPLIILIFIVSLFIIFQDLIGLGLAKVLGINPLIGLISSSITLTGGHGTAVGWGDVLEKSYNVQGATTIGIACATYGLVAGGIIGGPLANFIIKKKNIIPSENFNNSPDEMIAFEEPLKQRLIDSNSALEVLTMFSICLSGAYYLNNITTMNYFDSFLNKIPTFLWALSIGIIVRNILDKIFKIDVFDRCVDVFGNLSLSLFLAISLMSLKLWSLSGLAFQLLIILVFQTIFMLIYAYFITFKIMGGNYDAVVISAGHCGFGLGATPTAIANMQSVTNKYGISHNAFLIVPLVGAFFVDIVNATILQIITVIFF